MQTFSTSPPIKLVEEGSWLLSVTYFSAMNNVFNIFNEYNSFSFTMQCHWNSRSAEKSFNELNKNKKINSWTLTLKKKRDN